MATEKVVAVRVDGEGRPDPFELAERMIFASDPRPFREVLVRTIYPFRSGDYNLCELMFGPVADCLDSGFESVLDCATWRTWRRFAQLHHDGFGSMIDCRAAYLPSVRVAGARRSIFERRRVFLDTLQQSLEVQLEREALALLG